MLGPGVGQVVSRVLFFIPATSKLYARERAVLKSVGCQRSKIKNRGKILSYAYFISIVFRQKQVSDRLACIVRCSDGCFCICQVLRTFSNGFNCLCDYCILYC